MKHRSTLPQGILISENSNVLKDLMGKMGRRYTFRIAQYIYEREGEGGRELRLQ